MLMDSGLMVPCFYKIFSNKINKSWMTRVVNISSQKLLVQVTITKYLEVCILFYFWLNFSFQFDSSWILYGTNFKNHFWSFGSGAWLAAMLPKSNWFCQNWPVLLVYKAQQSKSSAQTRNDQFWPEPVQNQFERVRTSRFKPKLVRTGWVDRFCIDALPSSKKTKDLDNCLVWTLIWF